MYFEIIYLYREYDLSLVMFCVLMSTFMYGVHWNKEKYTHIYKDVQLEMQLSKAW